MGNCTSRIPALLEATTGTPPVRQDERSVLAHISVPHVEAEPVSSCAESRAPGAG